MTPTQVNEIYQKDLITIGPDASVEAAAWVMNRNHISCLFVMEEKQLIGMVTERDFLCKIIAEGRDYSGLKVTDIMTKEVVPISPETSVFDAAKKMEEKGIRHFPVMMGDKIIGVITETDLAHQLPGPQ